MNNRFLSLALVFLAGCASFDSKVDTPPRPSPQNENKAFLEELEKGTKLLVDDKFEEAEQVLEKLRRQNTSLQTWGMVSFNLGITLRLGGKYREAIQVFEEVLKSDLNDRDPAPHIMEHFRNYHYKACLEISYNYEQLKDYRQALKYMNLAKTKYKFQDICGTCLAQANRAWEARVRYLEEQEKKESEN